MAWHFPDANEDKPDTRFLLLGDGLSIWNICFATECCQSTFEHTHVDEMSHVNDQGTLGYGWKTITPCLSDRFLKPLTIIFPIKFPALIQKSIYSPVTNNQKYSLCGSLSAPRSRETAVSRSRYMK